MLEAIKGYYKNGKVKLYEKPLLIIALLICFVPVTANAWDGYDFDKGSYIEIDQGNLVRPGQDIEIYDYETGDYKEVEVQSVTGSGSGAEVEVYDYDTGEYRTFDMD